MGALIGARLLNFIDANISVSSAVLWTDSLKLVGNNKAPCNVREEQNTGDQGNSGKIHVEVLSDNFKPSRSPIAGNGLQQTSTERSVAQGPEFDCR